MTKSKIDPVELAEFWRFWKWQYTCRNTEYIQAYEKYEELWNPISKIAEKRTVTDKDWVEIDSFRDTCRDKFGWMPLKNPNHDSDSQKILIDLFNRRLNKEIAGFVPYEHDVDIWGLENGNVRYTIDFNKPLDQILAEVRDIYLTNAANQEARLTGGLPPPEKYKEITAELDKYFFGKSDEGFKIDDEIRAIGLWLWDYIKFHKVKLRVAIRDLDKIINLERSGLGSLDWRKPHSSPESTYRRITRYYNLSDKCIKEMKVLPMPS